MKNYPVWFDCDTGVDDAIALMTLHGQAQAQIVGISAVSGNAPLVRTFDNTRKVVKLMGGKYPVYPGAEKPMLRPAKYAPDFHGEDGLGGVVLPTPEEPAEHTPAWDALYAAAQRYPGELRLIAVGPLTNVAIAITKYPRLKTLLHSILIMGGAARGGNVTPCAEFNIYADPEAAALVFDAGVPIVMCGLDVTMTVDLSPADWDELAACGNTCGPFVRDIVQQAWSVFGKFGMPGVYMHDSCPVLYLTHPELFEGEEAGVKVETRSELTLGKTVTDLYSDRQFEKKNAFVVTKANRDAFIRQLKQAIKKLP